MRYIQSFQNDAAIQGAVDSNLLGHPYIALNDHTGKIDWDSKDIDYSKMYLTIEALTGGTLYWYATANNQSFFRTIEYSKNGGEWISVTSSNSGSGTTICEAVKGDVIRFRGDNNSLYQNASYGTRFNLDIGFEYKVYGNIMSLLYKDNFEGKKTLNNSYVGHFQSLFFESGVIDASKLVLPATTLANRCYESMFAYCSKLTKSPTLPATTLANYCYQRMFQSCFSLAYIKCLATNKSAASCTYNWVSGVAATGTFVKNPNMTSWTTGVNGIPSGWTVQDAQ